MGLTTTLKINTKQPQTKLMNIAGEKKTSNYWHSRKPHEYSTITERLLFVDKIIAFNPVFGLAEKVKGIFHIFAYCLTDQLFCNNYESLPRYTCV